SLTGPALRRGAGGASLSAQQALYGFASARGRERAGPFKVAQAPPGRAPAPTHSGSPCDLRMTTLLTRRGPGDIIFPRYGRVHGPVRPNSLRAKTASTRSAGAGQFSRSHPAASSAIRVSRPSRCARVSRAVTSSGAPFVLNNESKAWRTELSLPRSTRN